MAETIDTILHLVKRKTRGEIDFSGVHKLRRLEDRVPRVKQLLEEDGRFNELLAGIPNHDRSKTGDWSQFVDSEPMREIKQEFLQRREATRTSNVQATGEESAVETTLDATVVEITVEATVGETMSDGPDHHKYHEKFSLAEFNDFANDLNNVESNDSSETTLDAMLEAELATPIAQRGAVKRPREVSDEAYEVCQYYLKMLQQTLCATPAESLERQAWQKRARMSMEALAFDLSTFYLKSEPQAHSEGPLPNDGLDHEKFILAELITANAHDLDNAEFDNDFDLNNNGSGRSEMIASWLTFE
ncbi:hypothetical protein AB1Y20_022722 [Prymnesium parvum]|uniref:Uncharacterized protein n=1 Tax=Prymnesium parvum TaxID=97485 RepID=A0AB34JKE7_PRYPA